MVLSWRFACAGAALVVCGASGCERTPAVPGNDTAASGAPPPLEAANGAATATTWRERDGPFLVTATDSPHVVSLVAPDSSSLTGGDAVPSLRRSLTRPLVLIGRGGVIARATLLANTLAQRHECEWPRATLSTRDTLGDDVRWGAGFAGDVAAPVALDSLERLTRADSARLVADLARLASALPDDTTAVFRGIPFVVRNAWRFEPVSGAATVIAEISRRVAQEANQREERLLLVAERPAGTPARWRARWWARAQGTEETVETLDVLAVVRLAGDASPSAVVGHDAPGGTWQEIVVRDSTGSWSRRWRSGVSGACF